ncbi:MAG: hypothetical protein ABSC11_11495 [Smithella sp.]
MGRDPLEIIRQAAMVLACGGKICIGATSMMDGRIFPDQIKQLCMLGEWYKPRKEYFINAAPVRYVWFRPLSVRLSSNNFDAVVSEYNEGLLLHLINRSSSREEVSIELCGSLWKSVSEVSLLPQKEKVTFQCNDSSLHMVIKPDQIDKVDTILYLT